MRFGKMFGTCILLVAFLLAAGNAPAVTVVVSNQPTGTYNTPLGWTETTSLQDAFNVTAVTLIYVTKGKWAAPTSTVPAGVTIRGLGAQPYDVVIDGSGVTDGTLYIVSTGATLDNLTLKGGPNGIKIDPACDVTINNCYIRDNAGHGVACSGTVTMVNCSVSGNAGDGVHVESTTGTPTADISFCSLLYNGGSGVNTVVGAGATGATANVRYSLVTQNGTGGTIGAEGTGIFSFTAATLNETSPAPPPYWERTGEWTYGTPGSPTGFTGTVGNPDPVSGATGTNVLGVKLGNGDAGNYTIPSSSAVDTNTVSGATLPASASLLQPLTNPAGTIGDLNVMVNINPDGLNMLLDLTVVLHHSSGLQATLFTGLNLSPMLPAFPGPLTMVFDDESTFPVLFADEFALAAGVRPEQPLSTFDLLDATQGTWWLEIIYNGPASVTGTLSDVTLSVSPMSYATLRGLDYSTYSNPSMRFGRWLNMDATSRASIEVSTDAGATWTNIWSKGDTQVTDAAWTMQDIALPSAAAGNANVAVRWGYYAHPAVDATHTGDVSCSGWNLDDISFRGTLAGDASAGLKAGTGASITTTQNFVKFHSTGSNYDNVTPDADSTTLEALATTLDDVRLEKENATWNGKLATDTPYSVLKDKVTGGTNIPANDFEHDVRMTPDVGADEIGSGSGVMWYESRIQSGMYYIKAQSPGELQIELVLRGVDASTVFASYNSGAWSPGYRVYMLTNARNTTIGGDTTQMNIIPLNITRPADSDIIMGTNAVAISTMGPGAGLGANINDGAGHIVIDDGAATPTEVTPYGQAITGRNFVIDTQAPWLVLNVPDPGDPASVFVTSGAVTPFPDKRTIERRADGTTDGLGAKAFFNKVSQLGMIVEATMSDAFPYFRVPVGSLPATGIETAGFSSTIPASTVLNDILFGTSTEKPPIFWSQGGDFGVLAQTSSTATVTYTPLIAGNYSVMKAMWTLPGDLPYTTLGTYQIPIHFRGIDLAGNETASNELDPLELWWLREVNTQLQPGPINGEFKQPHFNWKLRRSKEPYPELANATNAQRLAACTNWPTYQFDLMYLNTAAVPAVYQLVTPPVGWPINLGMNTVLPFSWFQANNILTNPLCVDNWLLLTVLAVNDEAGNAEPWSLPTLQPNIPVTPYSFGALQNSGTDNWEVFLLSNNVTLDTSASINFFWYNTIDLPGLPVYDPGETNIGSPVRILWTGNPIAGSFAAKFHSLNGPLQVGDQISWQLLRMEAAGTAPTVLDSNIQAVDINGEISIPLQRILLPTTLLFPVQYKFIAQAVRTSVVPSLKDKTPAEVNFSVVDPTKEDVTVDTQQPVKVRQIK